MQPGLPGASQKDWPAPRGISYPQWGTKAAERGFTCMSLCLEMYRFFVRSFFGWLFDVTFLLLIFFESIKRLWIFFFFTIMIFFNNLGILL